MNPFVPIFMVAGAACGLLADRIAARWPDHEYDPIRPIDWRTFVVITFGALAIGAIPDRFGDAPELVLFGAVFATLILMMATDLDQRLLPDKLTLPLVGLGIAMLAWGGNPLVEKNPTWLVIVGAIAVPLVLVIISRPFGEAAIGGGDIKLLVGIGLLAGVERLVSALLVGAILGGVVIGVLVLTRRVTLKDYVPFGPFLIIGVAWALLAPAGL